MSTTVPAHETHRHVGARAPAGEPRREPPAYAGVAVLLPCLDEALTIRAVVEDFRRALPGATIFVFDNDSADATADEARRAGAVVVREKRPGKGNVMAAMLDKIDADYFVLADGDGTYPAAAAPTLLQPLFDERADMVVGHRLESHDERAFRPLHVGGNKLVRWCINQIFRVRLHDIMSGYRAFTREAALQLPVVASGFDVETEMTLQLLYRRFVIREVPVPYGCRPEGSVSKLNTYRDGARVLVRILGMFRAYRPLLFFTSLALAFFVAGAIIGYFPIREYLETRWVGSVPKAILAAGCMVLSAVCLAVGVLLDTLNYRLRETTAVMVRQQGHGRRFDVRAPGSRAP